MAYSVPTFHYFSEIVQHYRDFLEGKINRCPTCFGPLAEESKIILPQLLKINAAHIVSINSQPGVENDECQQRAYLDCLMREETAKLLVSKLSSSDFVLFAKPYSHSREIFCRIPVTIVDEEIVTNLPVGLCNDMDYILENSPDKDFIIANIWHVRIFDPIWGRETELFDQIVAIFD